MDQQTISTFLTGVSLFDMPPSLYREAGLLPRAHLRSLDALHLAAATRIDVEWVLTYDVRTTQSARERSVWRCWRPPEPHCGASAGPTRWSLAGGRACPCTSSQSSAGRLTQPPVVARC